MLSTTPTGLRMVSVFKGRSRCRLSRRVAPPLRVACHRPEIMSIQSQLSHANHLGPWHLSCHQEMLRTKNSCTTGGWQPHHNQIGSNSAQRATFSICNSRCLGSIRFSFHNFKQSGFSMHLSITVKQLAFTVSSFLCAHEVEKLCKHAGMYTAVQKHSLEL